MTAVLSLPQIRSLAAGMLALVIACSLLSFAAPRAQASSPVPTSALTESQISAIIALLASFGADQSIINNVRVALNGEAVTPPVISGAPTCSLRANPSAVAPGMSTVLTWSSTNATSAQWTNDKSGKDNIAPPVGAPATNGSASFTPMETLPVGVTSMPSVTLKVTGPYGSATCTAYISVVSSQQAQFDNTVFTQIPSATPTISGFASGVTQLKVVLLTIKNRTKIYESGVIQVIDGKWSIKVTAQIPAGEYMVYVYNNAGQELTNGGALKVTERSTVTTSAKATYQGFIDGNVFIVTKDITRADALTNCKQNATANPGRSLRCVWGGEEIYAVVTTYTKNQGAFLKATPPNGVAPLVVSFEGNGGGRTAFGGMRLEFGDGSTEVVCAVSGSACDSFTTTHKYMYGGNYAVRLVSVGEGSNVTVVQTNVSVVNASASLPCTAGSSSCPTTPSVTTASLSATPKNGAAPLAVTFKGSGGGRMAFGGARIDFGDGSSGSICDAGRSCGAFTVAHTYATAGAYVVRLIMVGEGSVITLAQTSVKVASPASTPTTTTPVPTTSSAGAFRTDGPMAFMAAAAAVPFTLAVDVLSSIFYWTGFY